MLILIVYNDGKYCTIKQRMRKNREIEKRKGHFDNIIEVLLN